MAYQLLFSYLSCEVHDCDDSSSHSSSSEQTQASHLLTVRQRFYKHQGAHFCDSHITTNGARLSWSILKTE